MAYRFREHNLEQPFLIPPDIRDWVPEGHLARFIDDAVGELDLGEFKRKYRAGRYGRAAYDPAMMLRVVLYNFSRGVFSSRKMEESTITDVGARFLAMNQHPDHSSFSIFRKRHGENLKSVFVQVVALCREMGMCSLGHVAIDGTIIKANSAKSKCVKVEELDGLIVKDEQLVQGLLDKWMASDKTEENAPELPKELRKAKSRLASLKKAKAHLDEIARKQREEFEAEEAARQAEYEAKKAQAEALRPQDAPDLKTARLQRGLTLKDLGERVGIRMTRVQQLETGERYTRADEATKFTEVLGPIRIPRMVGDATAPTPRKLPDPRLHHRVNLTEPESPLIGRRGKPVIQGYNGQFAVDSDYQIVVGVSISMEPTDYKNFVPMIEQVIEVNDGKKPREASGDSGTCQWI